MGHLRKRQRAAFHSVSHSHCGWECDFRARPYPAQLAADAQGATSASWNVARDIHRFKGGARAALPCDHRSAPAWASHDYGLWQEHRPLAARPPYDSRERHCGDHSNPRRGGDLAPVCPSRQSHAAHAAIAYLRSGPMSFISKIYRGICAVALLALGAVGAAGTAAAQIVVTDVSGREIRLEEPAKRILIDDGRYLVALSLIHPDPVSVLSAWPKDILRIDEAYHRLFPA